MSIKADCHLHSSFSGDSKAPMPEMIERDLSGTGNHVFHRA